MESNFFQPQLQARRQVALSISQLTIRLACRAKLAHILVRKNSSNLRRAIIPGHIDAFRRVAKIIQIEPKLPFLFSPNDVAKLSDEPRAPERRQPHHLSFVSIMRKTEKLRCRRIDNPERVRIFNLAQNLDRVPNAFAPHRRNEIAKAVEREQRRPFERRNEERTREMRPMMLNVMKPRAQSRVGNSERLRQISFQIAHLCRVPQTICELPRKPMSITIRSNIYNLPHWDRGRPARIFCRHVQRQLS